MYKTDNYPSKVLQDAVEAIGLLPGVGSRSAMRLSLHILKQDPEYIHRLASGIDRLATEVRYCRRCNMLCDDELCPICSDGKRDQNTICVVESVRDVMSIESTGEYKGLYHVLGGIISPINGIAPSDLHIKELLERINEGMEIILALNTDVEGETTAFYLYRQLEPYKVKVTTLARGLGFGDDLEYADPLTLGRSLISRQLFKP